MKSIIVILGIIGLIAFTPDANKKYNEEKKFKLEFTDTQVKMLWNAIDNSSAPHDQIKALETIIQQQYAVQLSDSTKKK